MSAPVLHKVYNIKTNEYITDFLDAREISKLIGISQNTISVYATKKTVYGGKYRFIREELPERQLDDIIINEMTFAELYRYWDMVRMFVNPNAKELEETYL